MGKVMTPAAVRWAAIAAVLAFPLCSDARAQAGATPWHVTERGMVRLVAATTSVGRGDEILVGVELRMRPGWKTYWRHPGEAGLPPRFDWRESSNIETMRYVWPVPKRFEVGGVESLGYATRVILPVRIKLAAAGAATTIRLRFAYALCRDICVPEETTFTLALATGTGAPSLHAAELARFVAMAPSPGRELGWHVDYVGHERGGDGKSRAQLMVTLSSKGAAFADPDLLVVGEAGDHYGRAAMRVIDRGRRVHFILPHRSMAGRTEEAAAEKGRDLVLTVIDGRRAGQFDIRLGGVQN
jgi:suppressor for copper-sensitivity B